MWDTTGKVECQFKGSCKRSVAAISLPSGASPKIKPGYRIGGQYEVYRVLGGEGKSGMGVVYVCYDPEARDIYALKTFQDKYLDSGAVKDSFKREALAWVQLDWHPYVVRAIGVKELDYRLFIVLEYVAPDESGRNTLTQYLKTPIPLSQALEWSIECCLGMEYAASKGVTPHRDLKPDNLMITRDGTLKITDFGLARLWNGTAIEKRLAIESRHDASFLHSAHNQSVVGTTPYAAPEQFEGQSDIRSDIYSFGVVLFQMAGKGKLPFDCNSSDEYHEAHKTRPVPKLKSRLYPMISRCMQKKPDDRYANFGELRHDLEKLYRSMTRAEPPSPPTKLEMGAWEYNNKGLSLYNVGLVDDAIREYHVALRLKPDLAIVHNNLGIALSDKGINEGAMQEYKEALRLDPSLAIAHNNLGTALKASGDTDEAIFEYREALRLNPSYAEAYNNLGLARIATGDLDGAMSEYSEAMRLRPDFAEAHNNLGILLAHKGLWDEAITEYMAAVRLKPDMAVAHNNLATGFRVKGKLDQAIKEYKKAIEMDPQYARAHNNLGLALFLKGHTDDAIREYLEALRIDEDLFSAYKNLADALYESGRFNEAVETYMELIRHKPLADSKEGNVHG